MGSGGIKCRQETIEENQELHREIERLKIEVAEYRRREGLWKQRWQRIAFHIRQKGMQVHHIDANVHDEACLPSERETNQILIPFDKENPFSGRI